MFNRVRLHGRKSVVAWTQRPGLLLLTMVLACALAAPAAAAPPANDDFADAELISGNPTTASGTNVDATKEVGEPDHGGYSNQRSVWWRWTASANGSVTIDTCGSSFETVLAVYTGNSVDGLTEVASSSGYNRCDGGDERRSLVSFPVTAGQVYRIAVDGWAGETGSVTLAVRPPPANDDFANAESLSGNPATASRTNVGATKEGGEPNHAGHPGGHSLWWRWTAPAAASSVTIDTCDSDFNTLLAVYTGDSVSTLSQVASNDNANFDCGLMGGSRVSFAVTGGQVYRIAVDGGDGYETGTARLALNLPPPPTNDDFASASPLAGQFASLLGQQNAHATKEPGEPDHAGNAGGRSVWFTWTAPASGATTVDTCDGNFDTLLAVYRGDAIAGLNDVATDDDSCLRQGGSFVEFVAEAGQKYRIAVDGSDGDTGSFDLYVELTRTVCDDGEDNDDDGKVDLDDPGCSGPADDDESNPPPPSSAVAGCADGQDNDGDGRVDLGDPGCSGPADNDERNPVKLVGPTAGNDILTGTAANNLICGLAGSDTIKGLGGNDTLFGDQCAAKADRTRARVRAAAAGDGNDRLDGGQGNDKLYGAGGNDRLVGGLGRDLLAGGAGKDKLDGGKGRDQLRGGAGNDSINARDGIRETVDCGKGKDTGKADKRDRLRGCERVRR